MTESTEVTAVVADEQSNKKRLKARECGKARNCSRDVGNVKYSNRDEKEKALLPNSETFDVSQVSFLLRKPCFLVCPCVSSAKTVFPDNSMRKKTQKMAESTEVTAVVADEQSNKKRLKARECGKARNC